MRLLLVLFLASLCAVAQSITGAISGTVTDPSGGVITGANIRLTSVATGAERAGATNEAARFFFGSLQPGSSQLIVEAQGFAGSNNRTSMFRRRRQSVCLI